jgi:predicted negative regulator of RcsB-dependent stress response
MAIIFELFGELYTCQGRPTEARNMWQKVVKIYEAYDSPKRAEIVRKLASLKSQRK